MKLNHCELIRQLFELICLTLPQVSS